MKINLPKSFFGATKVSNLRFKLTPNGIKDKKLGALHGQKASDRPQARTCQNVASIGRKLESIQL